MRKRVSLWGDFLFSIVFLTVCLLGLLVGILFLVAELYPLAAYFFTTEVKWAPPYYPLGFISFIRGAAILLFWICAMFLILILAAYPSLMKSWKRLKTRNEVNEDEATAV